MTDQEIDDDAKTPHLLDSQPYSVAMLKGELARALESIEADRRILARCERQIESCGGNTARMRARAAEIRAALRRLAPEPSDVVDDVIEGRCGAD